MPKLEAATLAGARVNFTDSAETFLVSKWSRIFQIRTTARPNSPDMPPKRTKKVRLGINISTEFTVQRASKASAKSISVCSDT